jgi:trimethylamine---corrinoid protein Co-methyltransferase
MKFTGQFLTEDEKNRIHEDTLRILAEVGIKFHGKKALQLLEKNGAKVDWDARIARFPAELVIDAISLAPSSFVLGARNPTYNYPLPSSVSHYALDGTSAFALDFETGEKRYGTIRDIENSLRIFQQMDIGVMAWSPTVDSAAPAHSRPLHEFLGIMKYCSKHGQHEVHRPSQVPYLVEALTLIAGSESAIGEKMEYSLIYCPVAPLMHDGDMLDAYMELGAWGMPVMVLPMPVTGTTGPASLFSNIVVANAEALSSIITFELAHPGRPVIYSSATGSVDFRNGAYLAGTPEMGLQSAALVMMGRYYGLPSTSAGCTSDAKEPGAEAILDKVMTTIPPVCAGSDIIVGIGEIESDQLLILEQLVVDNEIAHLCRRLYGGVDGAQAMDFYEDIVQVGPGGHFLGSRNTRRAAHSDEFYMSDLMDRHPYEAWLRLGKPGLYSRAREKVQEILAGPLLDPLPEDISCKLDEILLRADKELADGK